MNLANYPLMMMHSIKWKWMNNEIIIILVNYFININDHNTIWHYVPLHLLSFHYFMVRSMQLVFTLIYSMQQICLLKSYLLPICHLWYDKTIMYHSIILFHSSLVVVGCGRFVGSFWCDCITGVPSLDIISLCNNKHSNRSLIWNHRSCLQLPLCSYYRVSMCQATYVRVIIGQ
jgi:hypothetical protein